MGEFQTKVVADNSEKPRKSQKHARPELPAGLWDITPRAVVVPENEEIGRKAAGGPGVSQVRQEGPGQLLRST